MAGPIASSALLGKLDGTSGQPVSSGLRRVVVQLSCSRPSVKPRHVAAHAAAHRLERSHGRVSANDRQSVCSSVSGTVDAVRTVPVSDVSFVTTSYEEGIPVYTELDPTPAVSRLAEKVTTFIEEHRIRGYEAGPDRKATIVTIADLLQEASSNHGVCLYGRAERGIASSPEMEAKKLVYAQTRLQVQIDEYPTWGDVVEVNTWFRLNSRVSFSREWTLQDAATKKQFGRATSVLVMINYETRRLAKIVDSMRYVFETFAPNPKRFAVPKSETGLKIPEVEELFDIVSPMQVARRSDMDMNGHINNVTYLAWTLETVPEDVYNSGHLFQIEVEYKQECKSGDKVECVGKQVPAGEVTHTNGGRKVVQFIHSLRRWDGEQCTELVRARTTWLL